MNDGLKGADTLRVALHSVQKGVQEIACCMDGPGWKRSLPDELVWSTTGLSAAEAELDSAHAALATKVATAATELSVFAQPQTVGDADTVHVDAIHEAYLRLTPLLSLPSRRLHGWSDDQVASGIRRLREAVARAGSRARGEEVSASGGAPPPPDSARGLGLSDSLRRAEDLWTALDRLASDQLR